MEMFAFLKVGNKKSNEANIIRTRDISYIGPEGKRSSPVAYMEDGSEYYLPTNLEDYKYLFEHYKGFESADRCYTVNVKKALYLDSSLGRLAYKKQNDITFVTIARKYFDRVKQAALIMGINVK